MADRIEGDAERLVLTDDVVGMLMKLVDGNPGAINVCTQLLRDTEKSDPSSVLGPISYLLFLDTYGIYGANIWMLYKDICKENIVHTMALLRTVQMGMLDFAILKQAILSCSDFDIENPNIDIEDTFKKLQEKLPDFAKAQ